MLLFFVNGSLKIDEDRYRMRFLTESDEKTHISIIMEDEINNIIEHVEYVDGLSSITIDCSDFMNTFNWQKKEYIRISYEVRVKGEFCYKGSFPLISPKYEDTLKFIAVSCNNNKKSTDTNEYGYKKVTDINLWSRLSRENMDILIHSGNQVYGDYLVDNMVGFTNMGKSCNTDVIYDGYANLYRTAYGETNQGQAMRNSLNITVMNDHDIFKNFDTKKDNMLTPYYISGMNAYLDYQHQLHTDLKYKNLILKGDKSIFYDINYGKYHILCLDERNEIYNNKELLSKVQLEWIFYKLVVSKSPNFIIVSPRPIGHLNKTNAFIKGFLNNSAKDELLHPDNCERAKLLINIVNVFKSEKDFILISGCNSGTFVNSFYREYVKSINNNSCIRKPIFRQIATGPITRKPEELTNISNRCYGDWFQNKYLNIKGVEISPKISVSNSNSYGIIEHDQVLNYYIDDDIYVNNSSSCCFFLD